MASTPPQHDPPDGRVDALIHEYVERRRAGEALTPEAFAAEHPDLREELRPYLSGLALLEQVCPLRRDAAAGAAGGVEATELPAVPGYEVLREIGRGGMGVVYEAMQLSTRRVVALKVILTGPFASSSARRRFEREVQLAARLQHPAIARVLESGQVAGQKYYAMDYVSGVRLDRFLAGEPPWQQIFEVFQALCDAADYAHRHGVVHRDLKPANVLIDEDGAPHILDFGLAKATDVIEPAEGKITMLSGAGLIMGTLPYLSPEQAAGRSAGIDGRSDVYSLGVMLYEALTGKSPLPATERPSDVIREILEAPPVRPSTLCKRVDSELEAIVLKALEKDPARRYASAAEMGADLRGYVAGDPILARRPSGLYRLRKRVGKHRLAVVLMAAALLIGLPGLARWFSTQRRETARARREAILIQRRLEAGNLIQGLHGAKALHARHPRLAEAVLVWSQAQYRNQMQEEALAHLERDMHRLPSPWAGRALLAEMYQAAGNAEKAAALEAGARPASPDDADAWYVRSFASLDLGRSGDCAQRAVEREPAHTLAWCRLAWLRLQAGELSQALHCADRLIELGQSAEEWTVFKGQVLAKAGRFEDAIAMYSRVAARRADALVFRAHALRRLGRFEEAVTDYTHALAVRTPEGSVWEHYQRATPLWILGRREEALADYRQVRMMLGRPFYADARRVLILRELGRDREADAVLRAALQDVQDGWLRQILRCLAGQLGPQALIAEAEVGHNLERRCEAYYYAAEISLLSDDRAAARQWFQQCLDTGVQFDLDTLPITPMNEFELADWRLRSLFGPA